MNIYFVILALLLVGAVPLWPYSSHWGYYPGGTIGLILLIAIVYSLTNRRAIQ